MKKLLPLLLMGFVLVGCNNSKSITIGEAKKIALKEVAGEVVLASEESDDGKIYFDIDVLKDNVLHEFEISSTGKITKHEKDTQTDDSSNNQTTTGTDSNTNTNTNNGTSQTKTLISAEEANRIAINKVGGGNVTSNDLDDDNDDASKHYEIEIDFNNKEYDLIINAYTGDIVSFEEETNNHSAALISADEANRIATSRVGGGTVTSNELDDNDGTRHYEIEITFNNNEYDVVVNAVSGAIISFEQED